MTNIEKAKQLVRDRIPELKELSFGCEVQYKNATWDRMTVLFKQNDGVYTSLEPNQPRKEHLFKIIGHEPQLQHYMQVMGDYFRFLNQGERLGFDRDDVVPLKQMVAWHEKGEVVFFDLKTGQPATEEDAEKFIRLVS